MGFGFEMKESFSGSYYRLDEPLRDHAIRISLRLGVDGMRRFLRERKVAAEGTVHAEKLAEREPEGVPTFGALTMKLFDEKRIPYDLTFEGDDGRVYRLRGQRDFFMHDAVDSLTMLPASLYDDANVEIGRALLRFDPKTELPALLRSFRPRVRVARLSSGARSSRGKA
ncbi:MAG: hypothetical protein JWP87_3398 [Labilithrix sp.]|nr:hypothetical protein [Labilithrix sp.]